MFYYLFTSDILERLPVEVVRDGADEPVQLVAGAQEVVGVDVDIAVGLGVYRVECRHGQGAERERVLRAELVLPEHEARLDGGRSGVARLKGKEDGVIHETSSDFVQIPNRPSHLSGHWPQVQERLPRQPLERVPLNVRQSVLDVQRGVLQLAEHVVGEHELIAAHAERLARQAVEPGHAQDVELLAPRRLEAPHGDAVEAASVDGDLPHAVEAEGEAGHALRRHLLQPEAAGDADALERVPGDGQRGNLDELDGVQLVATVAVAVVARPGLVDASAHHQRRRLEDGDVGQVGQAVEQPGAEADLGAAAETELGSLHRGELGVGGRLGGWANVDFLNIQ